MTGFAVPEGVHAVSDQGGNLVVLDQRTGHWHTLNRTGASIFEELCRSADLDLVVKQLGQRHQGVPAERIRADAENMTAELVRRGLLEPPKERAGRTAGVLMVTPDDHKPTAHRHRLAALVGFLLALVLLRLPFRISTTVVTALKRRMTRRDATRAEALQYLAATRRTTRHHPGRVACLETSLTAVLTAVLLGRRLDWCFGFAVDPQTFHAWIEVANVPVVEPLDDPVLPTYRRVLRV